MSNAAADTSGEIDSVHAIFDADEVDSKQVC
jgi:hypothetical protein